VVVEVVAVIDVLQIFNFLVIVFPLLLEPEVRVPDIMQHQMPETIHR
jgi:hypothetical protein